ncbi:MAG: translation initiation factor IF-2 N-terminal domain-containing protein, partial [Pseudonocardiaceae bacterium]
MTTPAGGIGGDTDAPEITASDWPDLAFSLPDKLRVHALAKLLAVSSKDVMAALAELDIVVRSAQSSIDREAALRVLRMLLPDPEPEPLEIDEVARRSEPETPLPPVVDAPARPAVWNSSAPVFLPPAPFLAPVPPHETADAPDDPNAVHELGEDDAGADEAEIDGAIRRRRRRGRRGRGRSKVGGDGEDAPLAQGDIAQDDSDERDEAGE